MVRFEIDNSQGLLEIIKGLEFMLTFIKIYHITGVQHQVWVVVSGNAEQGKSGFSRAGIEKE